MICLHTSQDSIHFHTYNQNVLCILRKLYPSMGHWKANHRNNRSILWRVAACCRTCNHPVWRGGSCSSVVTVYDHRYDDPPILNALNLGFVPTSLLSVTMKPSSLQCRHWLSFAPCRGALFDLSWGNPIREKRSSYHLGRILKRRRQTLQHRRGSQRRFKPTSTRGSHLMISWNLMQRRTSHYQIISLKSNRW